MIALKSRAPSFEMFGTRRFWQMVLSFVALLALCYGLFYHSKLIAYPHLTEYREFVVLQTTKMFAANQNAFSVEDYPSAINIHGVMHGLISGNLCRLMNNCDLIYLKILSALWVLLSTLLIIAAGLRFRSDKTLVFSVGIFFYCLSLFSLTALPRPDALGLFFFLLSVLLPLIFPLSILALVVSIFAGVFGTLTKLYFALALPLVAVYLALFFPIRRVIFYSMFALVVTLGAVYVVKVELPTFFLAMSALTNSVEYSGKHLFKQLIETIRTFIGLLVLWLFACYVNRSRILALFLELKCRLSREKTKASDYDESNSITYYFFASVLSFISFLYLGLNTGAYMLYLYQLFIPFLLLFILRDQKTGVTLKYGILFLSFITLFARQGLDISEFNRANSSNWGRLETLIDQARDPLTTPLSAVLVDRHGKLVYLNGHNVPLGIRNVPDVEVTLESKLREQSRAYFELIERKLEDGLFDLVVCDPGTPLCKWGVLTRRYELREVLSIYLPHSKQNWDVSVYRPKSVDNAP